MNKLFGLSSVNIQGQLLQNRAEVKLQQVFFNSSHKNMEFNYTFPIPHKAQVHSFTMKIGSRIIRSEIMETEKAYDKYDRSILEGNSAAIVESVQKDILELSAGNIAPKETVTIELNYLQELKWEEDGQSLRWRIPTVLAPRYNSNPGPEEARKQPNIGNNSTKLNMSLNLTMLQTISQVSSPSHPITVSMDTSTKSESPSAQTEGSCVHVSMAKVNEVPDSDIILNISLKESSDKPTASLIPSPDGKFSLIQIRPEIPNYETEKKDRFYAFILDHSGSMSGIKLEQAKVALKLCLRQLSEKDNFMLVAFDHTFKSFSNRPIPFHEINLQKADEWIDSIDAEGGTEIYAPLEYILKKLHKERENIVLLFTDGQVGNENTILHLVKNYSGYLQLYPFGIDTAVNTSFINGLAQAGEGLPEYIYPGETIDDKVLRQFARIHSPWLEKGKILDNIGNEIEFFPTVPRRLYGGESYQFLHKNKKDQPMKKLQLHAMQKDSSITIPIETLHAEKMQGFERLSVWWALEKIRNLESLIPSDDLDKKQQLEKEIVNISLQYQILSTLTSLVAVMPREEKMEGMPEFIRIPVSLPRGWGNQPSMDYSQKTSAGSYNCFSSSALVDCKLCEESSIQSMAAPSYKDHVDAYDSHTTNTALDGLIRNAALLQNANGSVGKNSDRTNSTALFVMGMIISGRAIKKYRIALQKALKWLSDHDNSQQNTQEGSQQLLVACALQMGIETLKASNLITEEKIQECLQKMSQSEKIIYSECVAGLFTPLWHKLFSNIKDENNTEEVSSLLLEDIS